jgi:hypothetical protein
MKRVKLDGADNVVQEFARTLAVHREGAQVELEGRVLFKIIPPERFSEAEKAALLQQGRELVRRARERNKGVSAHVLEREVREAVAQVRGKKPR